MIDAIGEKVYVLRCFVYDHLYPLVHHFGILRDHVYRKVVSFGARYVISPETLRSLNYRMKESPYPSILLGVLTHFAASPLTLACPEAALGIYAARGFLFSCLFSGFSYSLLSYIHELRTSRRSEYANVVFDHLGSFIRGPFTAFIGPHVLTDFVMQTTCFVFTIMFFQQFMMANYVWYANLFTNVCFNAIPASLEQTFHFWAYFGSSFYHANYVHYLVNFCFMILACGNSESLGFHSPEEVLFFMTTAGVWANFIRVPLSLVALFHLPQTAIFTVGASGILQALLGLSIGRDFFAMTYYRNVPWLKIPTIVFVGYTFYNDIIVRQAFGMVIDGSGHFAGLLFGLFYPFCLAPLWLLNERKED